MLKTYVFGPRSNAGIVKQNLVFHFDPANQGSFNGTDNVLYDLSGNNNLLSTANFTLSSYYDGKSFSVGSGRSLSGIIANGLPANTTSITISMWIKGNSTTRYQYPCLLSGSGGTFLFDLNDTDSSSAYKTIWFYWNTGGSPLCALSLGALGGNAVNPGNSDLLNNTWHSVIFRRDYDNAPYTDIFVNGVKIAVGNPGLVRVGNQQGAGGWSPGSAWYYGGSAFTGYLGSSWMYRTALSDAQILSNFNSEKLNYL